VLQDKCTSTSKRRGCVDAVARVLHVLHPSLVNLACSMQAGTNKAVAADAVCYSTGRGTWI
jgi:hypothetical protein